MRSRFRACHVAERNPVICTDDKDRALIKALFARAVERAGKQEAVATLLGVSHQRISAILSPHTTDLPSTLQLFKVQRLLNDPFLFDSFADAIRDGRRTGDVAKEAREATYAVVDLARAADQGRPRDELRTLAAIAQVELDDVTAVLADPTG